MHTYVSRRLRWTRSARLEAADEKSFGKKIFSLSVSPVQFPSFSRLKVVLYCYHVKLWPQLFIFGSEPLPSALVQGQELPRTVLPERCDRRFLVLPHYQT